MVAARASGSLTSVHARARDLVRVVAAASFATLAAAACGAFDEGQDDAVGAQDAAPTAEVGAPADDAGTRDGAGGDATPGPDASDELRPDCDGSVFCTGFEQFPFPWDDVRDAGPGTLSTVSGPDGGAWLVAKVPAGAGPHEHAATWREDRTFPNLPAFVRAEITLAIDARIATTSDYAELLFVRLGEDGDCGYMNLVLSRNNDLRANFSSRCPDGGGTDQVGVGLSTLQDGRTHHVVLDMPTAVGATPRVTVDGAPQTVSGPVDRAARGARLLVKVGARSPASRPDYAITVDDLVVRGVR